MTRIARKSAKGFTLVEILIVVIILGILAAIVIPQFTNASQDARKSSLTSQLQTIRSQVNLYALQHLDQYPPSLRTATSTPWAEMTVKSNADHTLTGGTLLFGPYLQADPVNPLNNSAAIGLTTVDHASGGGANPAGNVGWVFNTSTGKVWATSSGFHSIYNEGNPADPNNTASTRSGS